MLFNCDTDAAIRRLVYDLRPPLLVEHRLAGALRNLARLVEPQPLCVELPEALPGLPAAVEVALYRELSERRVLQPIAERLALSLKTIRNHIRNIFVKLQVATGLRRSSRRATPAWALTSARGNGAGPARDNLRASGTGRLRQSWRCWRGRRRRRVWRQAWSRLSGAPPADTA